MTIDTTTEKDWVFLKYSGDISPDQLDGVLTGLTESRRPADKPVRRLHDFRDADCRGLHFDHLASMVLGKGKSRKPLAGCKSAFIVNKTYMLGLVNQFAVLAEDLGLEVRAFEDADEARAWLLQDIRRSAATIDDIGQ